MGLGQQKVDIEKGIPVCRTCGWNDKRGQASEQLQQVQVIEPETRYFSNKLVEGQGLCNCFLTNKKKLSL